jgi:hypothetical protein
VIPPGSAGKANLTIPRVTLLGLADRPGSVGPALARDLAAATAPEPSYDVVRHRASSSLSKGRDRDPLVSDDRRSVHFYLTARGHREPGADDGGGHLDKPPEHRNVLPPGDRREVRCDKGQRHGNAYPYR